MMNTFLDWFEENKVGIIGSLTLHTVILFLLTFFTLRTKPPAESFVEIPLEMLPEVQAQEMLRNADPQAMSADLHVTNLSSNITADIRPSFSQARMAEAVESELRDLERTEFERLAQERQENGEEVVIPQLDPSKWNKELYMDRAVKPARVEGSTTVWYDLKDRVRGEGIPGYLCKDQGRVAVRVEVDRSGQVRKAEVDPAQSVNADDCMLEHALRSARTTPFNSSATAPDPQVGTVYFLFLPQ